MASKSQYITIFVMLHFVHKREFLGCHTHNNWSSEIGRKQVNKELHIENRKYTKRNPMFPVSEGKQILSDMS